MAKLVVELTNRCNLSCSHCYDGRHGGRGEIDVALYRRVLAQAKPQGFKSVSFTGGEPTLHREFDAIMSATVEQDYRFGFVTNGWNFSGVFARLASHRAHFDGLTFSLDGATAQTHDHIRGAGSFRRVMAAMSLCMVSRMPFTINMVVMAHNHHELAEMADLAAKVGVVGLRFCHFLPETAESAASLELATAKRREVEREIEELARTRPITIAMAPGHHTPDLFPCAPLQMREVNVDWRGRLTKCCHLSGHARAPGAGDVIADLGAVDFADAYAHLQAENLDFRARKTAREQNGELVDDDYFPCQYCENYYDKIEARERPAPKLWQIATRNSGRMTLNVKDASDD